MLLPDNSQIRWNPILCIKMQWLRAGSTESVEGKHITKLKPYKAQDIDFSNIQIPCMSSQILLLNITDT